jgi:hypothetical protein
MSPARSLGTSQQRRDFGQLCFRRPARVAPPRPSQGRRSRRRTCGGGRSTAEPKAPAPLNSATSAREYTLVPSLTFGRSIFPDVESVQVQHVRAACGAGRATRSAGGCWFRRDPARLLVVSRAVESSAGSVEEASRSGPATPASGECASLTLRAGRPAGVAKQWPLTRLGTQAMSTWRCLDRGQREDACLAAGRCAPVDREFR